MKIVFFDSDNKDEELLVFNSYNCWVCPRIGEEVNISCVFYKVISVEHDYGSDVDDPTIDIGLEMI